MLRFSELKALIDEQNNQVITESPIESFLGAPTELLGKESADKYKKSNVDFVFVHDFNPQDFKEGNNIPYTDLEYLIYSKPTNDLRDKVFNSVAFNREKNKVISTISWTVWASDAGMKQTWIKNLQNKHSNVSTMNQ